MLDYRYFLYLKTSNWIARDISLAFGQPCLIGTTPGPTILPSAIDDKHLNGIVVEAPSTPGENGPRRLEYFVQTVKLYEILKQVEGFNDRRTTNVITLESRLQSMLRLHKLITEWRELLPVYLKYEGSGSDNCHVGDASNTVAPSREPLGLKDLSRRIFCRFDFICARKWR